MTTSWRSRLARADRHLEEVEREVDRFLATEPYRVVGQVQADPATPKEISYVVRGYVDRAPDPSFADVLSDVVNNLRSSLDLIAYRLAQYGDRSAAGAEFPVIKTAGMFSQRDSTGKRSNQSGHVRTSNMSPAAQAAIERLQPYQGADPADTVVMSSDRFPRAVLDHPLYLIDELRRRGFHREPHITGAVAQVGFSFGEMRGVDMLNNPDGAPSDVRTGAFEDGAHLGTIRFAVLGPNPVMQMNLVPTFDVAFGPEGPAGGGGRYCIPSEVSETT